MTNIHRITPFMWVDDVAAAVDFFTVTLGFASEFQEPHYAFVRREGAAIRICQNHGEDGAPPGNRRYAYYVDVDDLAALIAEFTPRLAHLPADHVHGPVDQPYAMREFMIVAPDGNLIVFGQPIPG